MLYSAFAPTIIETEQMAQRQNHYGSIELRKVESWFPAKNEP